MIFSQIIIFANMSTVQGVESGDELEEIKWRKVARCVSTFCARRCSLRTCEIPPSEELDLNVFRNQMIQCLKFVFVFGGLSEDVSRERLLSSIAGRIRLCIPYAGSLDDGNSRGIELEYNREKVNLTTCLELLSLLSSLFYSDNSGRRGAIALFLHEMNNKLIIATPRTKAEATVFNTMIIGLVNDIDRILNDEEDVEPKGFSTSDAFSRSELETGLNSEYRVQFLYPKSPISVSVPPRILNSVISNFTRGAFKNRASRVDVVLADGAMFLCCDAPCPFADSQAFRVVLDQEDKGTVSGGQGYFYSNMAVCDALKREKGNASPHALSLELPIPEDILSLIKGDDYNPTFAIKVDLA